VKALKTLARFYLVGLLAFGACVAQKAGESRRPGGGGGQVTVTLVRWPYT
jgi:hypothetical protein